MVIIESPIFTRLITTLMSDDEYRLFQETLITRPDSGVLIKQSGGLRKVRWKLDGRGKREKRGRQGNLLLVSGRRSNIYGLCLH